MLNKKGFMAIEMLIYFILATLLILIFSTILLRSVNYKNNDSIKVYQSLDILRKSLIKYQNVTNFKSNEIEFADHVRVKIEKNQVYETPGYMPYLQKIKNGRFIFDGKNLEIEFSYKDNFYKQIIFYDKE
ncbi:hypothetical protein OKW23_000202 [Bacilli bacterium PM5-9]|nr:hypothetical protein [Bacilli bacterium PM5-9]